MTPDNIPAVAGQAPSEEIQRLSAQIVEARPLYGRVDFTEQCLEIMALISTEQRARARHLDTKTGTIAGFCATVLTLNVTLGRPLLEAEASDIEHTIISVLFLLGSLALAVAALVAVAGVLGPMGHQDLDDEAIDAYAARPKVATPPEQLRETWLQSMTEMAKSDRTAGETKGKRAKIAVYSLAIGLVCVAGEAVTLFLATL